MSKDIGGGALQLPSEQLLDCLLLSLLPQGKGRCLTANMNAFLLTPAYLKHSTGAFLPKTAAGGWRARLLKAEASFKYFLKNAVLLEPTTNCSWFRGHSHLRQRGATSPPCNGDYSCKEAQVSKMVIGAGRQRCDWARRMTVIGPNTLQVTQWVGWKVVSCTASSPDATVSAPHHHHQIKLVLYEWSF